MKLKLASVFALIVSWILALWLAAPAAGAQQTPDNSPPQGQPNSTQQGQDQTPAQPQTDQTQQPAPKKKKGFFNGLKSASGDTSAQNEATSSAGSKSVGEGDGEKIAATNPSAGDRQKVSAMESFSIPDNDLKKFKSDGHLESK